MRAKRRTIRAAFVALAVAISGGIAGVAPAETATAAASTVGWLHTDGGVIRDANDAIFTIKATAWFGMETSNCAPHGLWSISLDSGLAQIASMGFNTIRLPFSNECIDGAAPNSINYSVNPTLQGLSSLQLMDAFVARAKVYGLSVILDRHRPDSGAQSALWYTDRYSEAAWIADWKMLAARYKDNSTIIGVDLHNEPHGSACWGCGTASVDWRAAAVRGGNAVLAVNSKLLVIVEGVENQGNGTATWWGGGLADAAAKPVTLSVAHRVVYSPHDYPASIYAQKWFSASNYPNNLPSVWSANWGSIATSGTAPVLLGEFGTKLETTSDKQWLATMVSYLKSTGISFAYWSFNPNSGDTGGLVKDDWVTPQTAKLTALKSILGAASNVPVQTPAPTTPTPDPGTSDPTAPSTDIPSPTPSDTATPSPTPAPTPAPVKAKKLAAKWKLQSHWNTGYVAQFTLTTGVAANGWTMTWHDTRATKITNSWGMKCSIKKKKSITCKGTDWAKTVAVGQKVVVGLQVTGKGYPVKRALAIKAS